MAKKRHWSRAFTPRTTRNVHINISRVPPTLRNDFGLKCRRMGVSQRNLVLRWIQNWIAGRRPDEDALSQTNTDTQP